jgi:hypothetical protein
MAKLLKNSSFEKTIDQALKNITVFLGETQDMIYLDLAFNKRLKFPKPLLDFCRFDARISQANI